MPIDPSFAVRGPQWSVGQVDSISQPAAGAPSADFGKTLANELQSLQDTQTQASQAAVGLADGTVTDPTAAVMAVERARLSMQLASQVRTKAVESLQDLFHTQI
jgi:flagellar hook-basal body complex protein FliE